MSAVSALEVRDMSASFGGVRAVDGVSLDVPEGQVVGVVGPNGSGKTTFLNCVSGFVRPETGEIYLAGEPIGRESAARRARRGIGRSMQNPRPSRTLRVEDVLALGEQGDDDRSVWRRGLRPVWAAKADSRARTRYATLLEELGIPPSVLTVETTQLSHGILKLIDMARARLAAQRVLLLDEPTSGLSEHELPNAAHAIETARSMGTAVVVVEHNVQFLLDLADTVFVMDQGRCLASGDPHEVLRRPDVTEAYLGPHAAASLG